MQKLITNINLRENWSREDMEEKKIFRFWYLLFRFLPRFHADLLSSRKCYSLYYLQPLSKNRMLYQDFFMGDIRYEDKKRYS